MSSMLCSLGSKASHKDCPLPFPQIENTGIFNYCVWKGDRVDSPGASSKHNLAILSVPVEPGKSDSANPSLSTPGACEVEALVLLKPCRQVQGFPPSAWARLPGKHKPAQRHTLLGKEKDTAVTYRHSHSSSR